MQFTKEQTNITKGVAICLMFAHHLYAWSDRLLNGNNYIPLVPFLHVEAYMGRFGTICISMFLFLSGYGMFLGYLSSEKTIFKYLLVKLRDFYFTYWLYFLIFVPIGIFFFPKVTFWGEPDHPRYSAEPITFLKNFVGWDSTYNGEWWFIQMFILTLLLLFPLYTKLAYKSVSLIAFISLCLFYLSFKVDIYNDLGFIYWQTSFAIGIICAKLKFFSSPIIKELDKLRWMWVFAWLSLCFFLRLKVGGVTDFLITPFFIYFSVRAIATLRLSRLFAYLGIYSFDLWLIHSFFCYYYFQDIVYFPKWSPLIFMLLTIMSLLSVLGIQNLRSYALRLKFLTNAHTGQIEKL